MMEKVGEVVRPSRSSAGVTGGGGGGGDGERVLFEETGYNRPFLL